MHIDNMHTSLQSGSQIKLPRLLRDKGPGEAACCHGNRKGLHMVWPWEWPGDEVTDLRGRQDVRESCRMSARMATRQDRLSLML